MIAKRQLFDVEPWLAWGNSPADTTTLDQRVRYFTNNTLGQAGFNVITTLGEYYNTEKKRQDDLDLIKIKEMERIGRETMGNHVPDINNLFRFP